MEGGSLVSLKSLGNPVQHTQFFSTWFKAPSPHSLPCLFACFFVFGFSVLHTCNTKTKRAGLSARLVSFLPAPQSLEILSGMVLKTGVGKGRDTNDYVICWFAPRMPKMALSVPGLN